VAEGLPLPTLLSQAFVAFTIECDNEFEHRFPHGTTNGPATGGPWLVSMAMWFNCMRFLGEEPITVAELERRARTPTNLAGMQRWRYIDVEPTPDEVRPKPPQRDMLVRPTRRGRQAQEVWAPLCDLVEQRWRDRSGARAIATLREGLVDVVTQLDPGLPDCMPILGYGLRSAPPTPTNTVFGDEVLPLSALLARPLLSFALDFERATPLSLALCADILRVLDAQPVPVRDLPRRSGVSKEAISMAIGVLEKGKLALRQSNPSGGPGKTVRLTPLGQQAQIAYHQRVRDIEDGWKQRFEHDVVARLRGSLEPLVGDPGNSPLFGGLEPYPDGWRASVRRPETLPHFPMVLHRGGYPDGS
jgi:DNA-binding MarR family transcriptional regulator